MKTFLLFCISIFVLLGAGSCSKAPETSIPPVISFANEEGIYQVKAGRSVTIEPVVSNAERPSYVWTFGGEIVSRDAVYAFTSNTPGQYFLTFRVDADNGSAERELRVDVLALAPPNVSLPAVDGYIYAVIGHELEIVPAVAHGEGASYQWLLEGQEVSTQTTYTFKQDDRGDYNLLLIVSNEDGEGRAEATLRVGDAPALSFFFENENLPVPLGRTTLIAPYISNATASTSYIWEVDGVVQAGETGTMFRFTPAAKGVYEVRVTGVDAEGPVSAGLTVTCVEPEGTYYRAATGSSSAKWNKVYEFLPAPGQFINEGYTATTMKQAVAYAEERLTEGAFVSLGGFGGYIVVGFDHSILNAAGSDLAVGGNAFGGSSDPGIVWVMQDENGNGLPDDTWYELKGSETGKPETRQLHAVTYYKPAGSRENVRWTDNNGESGTVDVNGFHTQDSYYPNWVSGSSYTLRGTYLEARNYDSSGDGSFWVNAEFDWGYADNFGSDYVENETLLDLSHAIYQDGTPAVLQYIDFVKVQVAVNAKSDWLGEISTDVFDFRDPNL